MKTFITIIGLLIASATQAQQTGFYYGTRGGLGESLFEGGGIQNPTGKLLWQIGGASAYQFHKNVGVMADFLLTGRGTKANGITEQGGLTGTKEYAFNEKVNVLSVDVPIAAKLSVGNGNFFFKAYAGYSLNFHLGGAQSRTYDDSNYNADHGFTNKELTGLETMDQGIVYGLGVDVRSGDGRLFFLELRKSQGQNPIGKLNGSNMTQQYFTLHAGYLFH
ncbi:MAG: outer membrane beta-barrel protein [Bacteroidetes bacterium]|nr:outer membrane beta-barrel protein [Bacteroidota bacterium]